MIRIDRKEYLNFLIESKDKQIIKVVSGVRRCGKSTLFEIYKDYLIKNGVKKNFFIYNNFSFYIIIYNLFNGENRSF